ncbi:MAG: chromate efflux transporter [Bacteriovoracaceae bacterium]|nr:chromate efflux transporter [Bacteriovoracaceae bacterium]
MISLLELIKIWTYVALHSFGGPAGQIAVIHKKMVEEKKLISESQFLEALNFCMLLPGPEAQQLATYLGWKMRGTIGGLIAGGLFIIPGVLSILGLSYLYLFGHESVVVAGIFYGIKPAIIVIVMSALYKIAKKSLIRKSHFIIALFSLLALGWLNAPFPLVIATAAFIGIFQARINGVQSVPSQSAFPSTLKTLKTLLLWLCVWLVPLLLLAILSGPDSGFTQMGIFFSKMSLVTFGGAYAALSYISQQAVQIHEWLTPTQMLDGLGLAETTPGPLIIVVQFIGFMGAHQFAGIDSPYLAPFIGSMIASWMTFAPCFLWIFVGAPYVEFLSRIQSWKSALQSISAAVVGVIAQLSLWFMIQVIYPNNEWDYAAFIILLLSLGLQLKLKLQMTTILFICSIAGIVAVHL